MIANITACVYIPLQSSTFLDEQTVVWKLEPPRRKEIPNPPPFASSRKVLSILFAHQPSFFLCFVSDFSVERFFLSLSFHRFNRMFLGNLGLFFPGTDLCYAWFSVKLLIISILDPLLMYNITEPCNTTDNWKWILLSHCVAWTSICYLLFQNFIHVIVDF